MKVKFKENNITPKKKRNEMQEAIALKRAPTSNYNYLLKYSISNRINYEKSHYEADLLLDEEDDFQIFKNEPMFEKKKHQFL